MRNDKSMTTKFMAITLLSWSLTAIASAQNQTQQEIPGVKRPVDFP